MLSGTILYPGESWADDWGYDGVSAPSSQPKGVTKGPSLGEDDPEGIYSGVEELKARPGVLKPDKLKPDKLKPDAAKSASSAPLNSKVSKPIAGPPAKAAPKPESAVGSIPFGAPNSPIGQAEEKRAAISWVQLLQGLGEGWLSPEQQKRYEEVFVNYSQESPKARQQTLAILKFYPDVVDCCRSNVDLEGAYKTLFRALCRLRLRSSAKAGNSCAVDDVIQEVLGAQRIAVPGDPALTEDAVNAYADMACFIYEQRNDGKTVDAVDNRTLFAKLICQKFSLAPTRADQEAMLGFDLSWAKFKILWLRADTKTRALMMQSLSLRGAGKSLSLSKDAVLEKVLLNWPF